MTNIQTLYTTKAIDLMTATLEVLDGQETGLIGEAMAYEQEARDLVSQPGDAYVGKLNKLLDKALDLRAQAREMHYAFQQVRQNRADALVTLAKRHGLTVQQLNRKRLGIE